MEFTAARKGRRLRLQITHARACALSSIWRSKRGKKQSRRNLRIKLLKITFYSVPGHGNSGQLITRNMHYILYVLGNTWLGIFAIAMSKKLFDPLHSLTLTKAVYDIVCLLVQRCQPPKCKMREIFSLVDLF